MYELRAHQSAPVYQILPLSADMEHYAQLLATHGRSHRENKINTPSRGKYELCRTFGLL